MNNFPQKERSFSVREIEILFSKGRHRVEGSVKMVVRRELTPESGGELKSLFSVPKRAFKRANKRNLIRRRMKEAYRLNRSSLKEINRAERISIAWIYVGKEVDEYQIISENISKHINWLIKNVQKDTAGSDSVPNKGI